MIFGYLFITMLVVASYMIVRVFEDWIFGAFGVEAYSCLTSDEGDLFIYDATRPEERMYWGEGFMGDTMGSISTSGDPF